ncbi:MAG TPA: response regulator [Azospirillaceae bacterium]|nr:response regulator [Azospirillaceae bacterium]
MATILVTDDDSLLRDLVEFKLIQRGYDVLTAEEGETALTIAAERRPDLIVLDGMMPGMDGFQVLRRLQETAETATIPVIMLTARRQERDIVAGLSLGARDYLVKPFMPEELVARIRKILGEPARPA